ncbi:DUF6265 family protein [Stenotrophomonas sp. PS02289]|uniref:DUF6265 family protein n=1 Tax=Stenotrophomonas sp. PS02289 TaxID=2991422 RepID=UPI00249BC318|nr:DUF6265 family protein [Stenotrophomonas sp. PS02289]
MIRISAAVLGSGLAMAATAATPARAQFDWLAGHWCGEREGRQIEEVWLPEAGGTLLGMSRTLRDGRTESFEFMRLVAVGQGAGFHVQPNGVAPTVFTVASQGEGWAVFENAAHDFPNRIAYRREGDELKASISGPGEDGKRMEIPFDYRRCAPSR